MALRVTGWSVGIKKEPPVKDRRLLAAGAPGLVGLDRDLTGFGLFLLGELDGQNPILKGCPRFLRVDVSRQRVRPGEVAPVHLADEVRLLLRYLLLLADAF